MGDKIGSGRRFRHTEAKLAAAGAKNPAGLAAFIGRKKYGTKRFNELAAAARREAEKGTQDPDGVAKPEQRTRV